MSGFLGFITGKKTAWVTLLIGLIFAVLAFGPLAEGNRAWQIQFWPDKKNLVARQVEALLNSKPGLTAADLDNASVVVQGLTAYEYLLFDPALDLNNSEQKARYCPLLVAIGEHQQSLAADILASWQSKDGMAAQLREPEAARTMLRQFMAEAAAPEDPALLPAGPAEGSKTVKMGSGGRCRKNSGMRCSWGMYHWGSLT